MRSRLDVSWIGLWPIGLFLVLVGRSSETHADAKRATKGRVDMTVYGIPLGQPLPFPKCPDREPELKHTCWKPNIEGLGDVDIWLRDANGELGEVFVADLREGIFVRALLTRPPDEESVHELVTKYGKPTRARTLRFQNGYGAVVERPDLEWILPGLYVHLTHSTDQYIITSNLTIELERFHKARREQEDEDKSKRPRL